MDTNLGPVAVTDDIPLDLWGQIPPLCRASPYGRGEAQFAQYGSLSTMEGGKALPPHCHRAPIKKEHNQECEWTRASATHRTIGLRGKKKLDTSEVALLGEKPENRHPWNTPERPHSYRLRTFTVHRPQSPPCPFAGFEIQTVT